jgi:hypothetical protein
LGSKVYIVMVSTVHYMAYDPWAVETDYELATWIKDTIISMNKDSFPNIKAYVTEVELSAKIKSDIAEAYNLPDKFKNQIENEESYWGT